MEFIQNVANIHQKHNKSFSHSEGMELVELCTGKPALSIIGWSWTARISRVMHEHGAGYKDSMKHALRDQLTLEHFIMASMALQLGWDVFDEYLEDIVDDTHDIYSDYLLRVHRAHSSIFWSHLFKLSRYNTELVFGGIIDIAINKQRTHGNL